jgi:DNA (cytosine-5)-methyltransferase 1
MSIERYKAVPPGGNRFDLMRNRRDITPNCWKNKKTGSTDVFGRMWWNEPAPTIRTEFFKPEKGRYLHPEAHRPITIREAARLQTFPDAFVFLGSNTQVAKQIGNAVPVILGERIAIQVRSTLTLGGEVRNRIAAQKRATKTAS